MAINKRTAHNECTVMADLLKEVAGHNKWPLSTLTQQSAKGILEALYPGIKLSTAARVLGIARGTIKTACQTRIQPRTEAQGTVEVESVTPGTETAIDDLDSFMDNILKVFAVAKEARELKAINKQLSADLAAANESAAKYKAQAEAYNNKAIAFKAAAVGALVVHGD